MTPTHRTQESRSEASYVAEDGNDNFRPRSTYHRANLSTTQARQRRCGTLSLTFAEYLHRRAWYRLVVIFVILLVIITQCNKNGKVSKSLSVFLVSLPCLGSLMGRFGATVDTIRSFFVVAQMVRCAYAVGNVLRNARGAAAVHPADHQKEIHIFLET